MDAETIIMNTFPIRDPEVRSALVSAARIETFQPGEVISHSGDTENYLRLLIKGVVRGYMVDSAGKETTVYFVSEQYQLITGNTLMQGIESDVEIQSLKTSQILTIPNAATAGFRTHPEIRSLYIKYLTRVSDFQWRTKKMLYMKTARERYEWFLKEFPGLIDQVQHSYIASFLNITPVTLSRVRHSEK